MTDDEREAREWLKQAEIGGPACRHEDVKHRATILALLDAPRMPRPKDVTETDLLKMLSAHYKRQNEPGRHYESMRAAYQALYDHFTAPPKPQQGVAWQVVNGTDWVTYDTRDAAEIYQRQFGGRIVKLVEAADER